MTYDIIKIATRELLFSFDADYLMCDNQKNVLGMRRYPTTRDYVVFTQPHELGIVVCEHSVYDKYYTKDINNTLARQEYVDKNYVSGTVSYYTNVTPRSKVAFTQQELFEMEREEKIRQVLKASYFSKPHSFAIQYKVFRNHEEIKEDEVNTMPYVLFTEALLFAKKYVEETTRWDSITFVRILDGETILVVWNNETKVFDWNPALSNENIILELVSRELGVQMIHAADSMQSINLIHLFTVQSRIGTSIFTDVSDQKFESFQDALETAYRECKRIEDTNNIGGSNVRIVDSNTLKIICHISPHYSKKGFQLSKEPAYNGGDIDREIKSRIEAQRKTATENITDLVIKFNESINQKDN